MRVIRRIRMPGLLSFPPDMGFFDLQSCRRLFDELGRMIDESQGKAAAR